MDAPNPRFRDRLAAVLRRDTWERDLLAGELVRAQVLVAQCRQRWQAALAELGAAEVRMRALHRHDQPLDLASRQRLHDYLAQAHALTAARLAEWQQGHDALERLREQFERQQTAVRVLEKHRDRRRLLHDDEQRRRAQALADASWLMREGRR